MQKVWLSLVVIFLVLSITSGVNAKVRIKFASLVPEGTAWANILKEGAREIKKKTNKRVKIKYYLGGKKGEEPEMIQKMKIGEIDAVGVSGMGMGDILKEIRVIDLPMLFNNYTEYDFVRFKVFNRFADGFKKAGYIFLAMGETGFVYNFSNIPIREIKDLRKAKTWIYKGEPIGMALVDIMGINAIPLGITDVLTSLQTGLIESCYAPPVGAIAFQWHTKVKYISDRPLTNGAGGILMRKSVYDRIIPKDRVILHEVIWAKNEKTIKLMRQDNQQALQDLTTKFGLEKIKISEQGAKEQKEMAVRVRDRLIGEYYPKELLDQITNLVKECRAMGEDKCAQAIDYSFQLEMLK